MSFQGIDVSFTKQLCDVVKFPLNILFLHISYFFNNLSYICYEGIQFVAYYFFEKYDTPNCTCEV